VNIDNEDERNVSSRGLSSSSSPGHSTALRVSNNTNTNINTNTDIRSRSRSPRLEVGHDIYGQAWEVEGSQDSLIDKSIERVERKEEKEIRRDVVDAEEYGDGIGEMDEDEDEGNMRGHGHGHLVAPTALRAGNGTKFVESFD
jgi:hypothetical protein